MGLCLEKTFGHYFHHFVLQTILGSLIHFGDISIKAICKVSISIMKCSNVSDCVIIQLTQTRRGKKCFGLFAWSTNGL
jgi:hypothetical protein